MNEPLMSPQTKTPEGRKRVEEFLEWACARVRGLDPNHPRTIGAAGGVDGAEPWVGLQDVISCHYYKPDPRKVRKELARLGELSRRIGKPVLMSECGKPGTGQSYEMVIAQLQEAGIGWYLWELMIAKTIFNRMTGLIYPDGSCRRRASVAAVAGVPERELEGFPQKPDEEGVPLGGGKVE